MPPTAVGGLLGTLMFSMITREEWKANPPANILLLDLPIRYVIIHHSYSPDVCHTTEECILSVQSIQKYHQKVKNWDDIGYNFAIGGDGNVYEGRGWKRIGAHAYHWNSKSIGIVFIGDFTDKRPSEKMQERAKELIAHGVANNYIDRNYILYGHGQVGNTECPGKAFLPALKSWPHWKYK